MILNFDASALRSVDELHTSELNPIQWQQSMGLARQVCARVFRDGGQPADALMAFGVEAASVASWDKAVEMIAGEMSRRSTPNRRAA